MTQIPAIQGPQYPITLQPSYNAVKIDIHNPQVNAPVINNKSSKPACEANCAPAGAPVTAPMYEYPKAPIYEVPKQSVYEPKQPQTVAQPPVVKEVPTVPPPVIVKAPVVQSPIAPIAPTAQASTVQIPIIQAPVIQAPAAPIAPIGQSAPIQTAVAQAKAPIETKLAETPAVKDTTPATAQKVEIKAPEVSTPKVDVNEFIAKLTTPDFDKQASAIESIAEMAQSSPDKATELLDTKIIDSLLGIMGQDTSKLAGPTSQQLKTRENIINGITVSAAEMADANKITPMEQAERNKQYAIYTVAILEKLYGSEIEKISKNVVPMTELPGAAGIVEQIKNNKNPMVRVAGIDALSYIQRPEYQKDLTTLFTVAKNDQDINVQQAAAKALEKLAGTEVKTPEKATA